MAEFQSFLLSDATATATVNDDETLVKVSNAGALTRIALADLIRQLPVGRGTSVIPSANAASLPAAEAYAATPAVAGDQTTSFLLFSYPDTATGNRKQGLIFQDVSDRRTTQYIVHNGAIYVRAVHFPSIARTTVSSVGPWRLTGMATGFSASGNSVRLRGVHGDSFADAIPTATTTAAGVMSREDKQYLEWLKSQYPQP